MHNNKVCICSYKIQPYGSDIYSLVNGLSWIIIESIKRILTYVVSSKLDPIVILMSLPLDIQKVSFFLLRILINELHRNAIEYFLAYKSS